jgi:CPA1 family monovalent cation:H+ antiporter
MYQVETVLALLVAVAVLATVAHRLKVAYPILLVVGGLAVGFVPGLPQVHLDPDAVFLLFVPPLVYAAAVTMPWRDFRANLRPILFLAIGLVLLTMLAVAAVAQFLIDGMTWASAFVLAAIVAPTDTVAVVSVTERLRVPRRAITILEGESLVNDATALVAYRMAVVAVVTGQFSFRQAGVSFLWAAGAGTVVGLALGWLVVRLRRFLHHAPVEITVSLLTPFAAFLPAEAIDASGILAVVAAGLYVGRHGLENMPAETRLHGFAVWETLVFLLNGLAFILVGLELPVILDQLERLPWQTLGSYAALVSAAVVSVRLAGVFAIAYLPWLLRSLLGRRDAIPPWRQVLFVGWGGMRGIDSLVTALALPLWIEGGSVFPVRGLTIFLAFGVILATLVLQGLSLPLLIHGLGLRGGEQEKREEAEARLAAARAALARLEELARQQSVPGEAISFLRGLHERRLRQYQARLESGDGKKHEEFAAGFRRALGEVLQAQRAAVIELRDREVINDEVLREVEEDLDLEELRLEE